MSVALCVDRVFKAIKLQFLFIHKFVCLHFRYSGIEFYV